MRNFSDPGVEWSLRGTKRSRALKEPTLLAGTLVSDPWRRWELGRWVCTGYESVREIRLRAARGRVANFSRPTLGELMVWGSSRSLPDPSESDASEPVPSYDWRLSLSSLAAKDREVRSKRLSGGDLAGEVSTEP